MTSSLTPDWASFTTSFKPGDKATSDFVTGGMRSTMAGALVPGAGAGALLFCSTTTVGASCTIGGGATIALGCSGCADGRAQPRKNASPAANPRLICRTEFLFIKLFLLAPECVLSGSAVLMIHLSTSVLYPLFRERKLPAIIGFGRETIGIRLICRFAL